MGWFCCGGMLTLILAKKNTPCSHISKSDCRQLAALCESKGCDSLKQCAGSPSGSADPYALAAQGAPMFGTLGAQVQPVVPDHDLAAESSGEHREADEAERTEDGDPHQCQRHGVVQRMHPVL